MTPPLPPIVLQHGLFGFSNVGVGKFKLTYFNRIDRAMAARGHALIIPRVHPTSTIAKRAAAMKRAIVSQTNERVIVIAHSMGGLDARYMISRLGMEDRVAALVTVCTPHRGSPYADWCLKNLGKRLGAMKLARLLALDVRALEDLTTDRCARFNEKYPNAPGVKYISVSAARPWHRIAPWLLPSFKIVHDIEGPNDGLVSITSATWGEHAGTWSADHLHAINKRLLPEIHHRTGDVTPKYLAILDSLLHSRV